MPCVLCIDDNKDVLASVADVLRNCGYSTLIADSGAEGLRLLRTASVDVVVLDYEMPQMKGDVVAQAIRRHKPTLPIVLFAGAPDHVPERVRELFNGIVYKADFAAARRDQEGCRKSRRREIAQRTCLTNGPSIAVLRLCD